MLETTFDRSWPSRPPESAVQREPGSSYRRARSRIHNEVLTTGEVAQLCGVSPRTVSKWFDNGTLDGYRIPGGKDRRIPVQQLIHFMKQNGMPLNELMTGHTRVLIVDDEVDVIEVLAKVLEDEAGCEVEIASGGFMAGAVAERFRPHVLLLNLDLAGTNAGEVARHVKSSESLQLTKLIALSAKLNQDGALRQLAGQQFDGFLRKPFLMSQAVQAVLDAMRIVY